MQLKLISGKRRKTTAREVRESTDDVEDTEVIERGNGEESTKNEEKREKDEEK